MNTKPQTNVVKLGLKVSSKVSQSNDPRGRLRWWIISVALAIIALVVAGRIAVRNYVNAERIWYPKRSLIDGRKRQTLSPGFRDVVVKSDGLLLAAWAAPSANGAAVVLCHGRGGNRLNVLEEGRSLANAGFGVLMFDWPGQGESQGQIQWSTPEIHALKSATTWLSLQDGTDPSKIGAFGFSMGGYMLIRFAAVDTSIKAIAIAASPADLPSQVRYESGHWGLLRKIAARIVLARHGTPLDESPVRLVGKMSPRPVLVISGSEDDSVPPALAEQVYGAAHEPKYLYRVKGAGHGFYAEAQPGKYLKRIVDFFLHALV